MQFTYDPHKDAANILKHGLSLSDAPLVFNAVNKLTVQSSRENEISLRRASKQERKLYAENTQ
jgi:uncharacterized DUF497 family protein